MRPIFALILVLAACPAKAEDVTIFAAASLQNVLGQILSERELDARTVYAGSSALARQIAAGAPADIFISANESWMTALIDDENVNVAEQVNLASNALVVVGRGAAVPLDDLGEHLAGERIAMALVDAVPAGIYAKAAMLDLGMWDSIAPYVVETDNVRSALSLVATGAVPFAITYVTDVQADPRVSVLTHLPTDLHPPIRYPAARLNDSPGTRVVFEALSGPDAQAIFAAHGFLPPQ